MWCGRYPDLNLAAGTAVKFVWSGGHGVAKIPSGACPTAFNGPGISVVAPIAPSGTYTTPPLAAGTYWYTCPVRALSPLTCSPSSTTTLPGLSW